jgi:5'-methylthioadenosine phosphorylase
MNTPGLTLLVAVYLPPRALDHLGALVEERLVRTPFGEVGPLALRQAHRDPAAPPESPEPAAIWVQPYSGLPSRTDPRATLYAARTLGVRRLVSWDTGIALNPLLQRGQLAVATDLIDWTRHQPDTFAGAPGLEDLPPLDEEAPGPFCPESVALLHEAYPAAPPVVVVATDGPRRETAAEARMFRQWGADVICTNVAPEAFLARELGVCFSTLVTVAGYSADQVRRPVEGEVRHGLELAMTRLPLLLQHLNMAATCLCRP